MNIQHQTYADWISLMLLFTHMVRFDLVWKSFIFMEIQMNARIVLQKLHAKSLETRSFSSNFQIQSCTNLLLAGSCYLPLKNHMVTFSHVIIWTLLSKNTHDPHPSACTTMSAPVKHSWVFTSPEGVVMLTWPFSIFSLQHGQVGLG